MRDWFIFLALMSPFVGAFVRIKHPEMGLFLIVVGPCLLLLFVLLNVRKESKEKTPEDPMYDEYYVVADDFLTYKEGTEKAYFSKHPEKPKSLFPHD